MKMFFGIMMLVFLFGLMTTFMIKDIGWKAAIAVWLMVAGVCGWVFLAFVMIAS